MEYPRLIFEFDPRKAASNLSKHAVSFLGAMTVFDELLAATESVNQALRSLKRIAIRTAKPTARHRKSAGA